MFENKTIHMIGISGISMSGIAEILLSNGVNITGSTIELSKPAKRLQDKGVKITIGEDPSLVENADIVVYTAAISNNNSELIRAKELGLPVYERAKFLGLMTKEYKNVICISGTHGKSTTTGMVASCFLEANLNPTIQIGAYLPKIDANYHVGNKDYFIMEACEYVDSFLSFFPTSEIILNIDNDHLDYFKNLDNIKKSFSKYAHLLPEDGKLVLNGDDKNTMDIDIPNNINVLTYAINNNADVIAKNITFDELGNSEFYVYYKEELFSKIKLNVLGIHNVYNALATISLCIMYNIDKNAIQKGLFEYKGVERRFQLKGKLNNNVLIYDDYAHHPTEINSTINSVKTIKHNKNWAVFQAHTYSRTKEHLNDFANILKQFDNIIIAPIYAAREINIYDIHEEDLVNLIKKENNNVIFLESFEKIEEYLKTNTKENDLIITIGAGDINKVAENLVK